jgi:hypothetical protein
VTRYTISTFGPCCRRGLMAQHILIADGRRVVVHLDLALEPCPVRAGEMPETGNPREVQP